MWQALFKLIIWVLLGAFDLNMAMSTRNPLWIIMFCASLFFIYTRGQELHKILNK